jgi:beta-lactamase class A
MVVRRRVSGKLVATLAVVVAVALGAIDVDANLRAATPATVVTPATRAASSTQVISGSTEVGNVDPAAMAPIVVPPRDLSALATAVQDLIASSGASVGVTVVELGGTDPVSWSVNGSQIFTAASTYKLAALMLEAENIAAGTTDPNGLVCYQDDDYEAGWFDDYADGVCFTRNELAVRAGTYSDNTAGHMLVRDVGGVDALNAWAASLGATNTAFLVDNTTTSADLAALWLAETKGLIGGAAAQAWLYPLLIGTRTESGVPAGVPGEVVVVHKTGTIDQVDNDAALVTSGPDGDYLVVVMTDGLGGDAGWQLIAGISAEVWQFEAERSQ